LRLGSASRIGLTARAMDLNLDCCEDRAMNLNTKSRYWLAAVRKVSMAGVLIGGACISAGATQVTPQATDSALVAADAKPHSSANWQAREGLYFKRNWGIDIVGVKPVSSGYMLAFRYRILDPEKAKMLNDMKSKAYIIDEASGIRLAVPAMENVGELRTGSAPIANRTYFMIFGNPGKVVKSGSLISVVAGNFQVNGLVVD
jgi:hypothetical protein